MTRPVFHILVFGCHRLNPKDIEASTRYRGVHLIMTAITENLFQGRGYGALVIYAGVEDREALLDRFRLHSPFTPIIILSGSPDPKLFDGKSFVWYADPSDREKFIFSLSSLWHFLEIFLARRAGSLDEDVYAVGGGSLSFKEGTYRKGEANTPLSAKQLELMKMLVERRGEIVPRSELMDKIWLKEKFVGDRIIDTNVVALRKLFGDRGRQAKVLQTCHGLGYRLAFESAREAAKDDGLDE